MHPFDEQPQPSSSSSTDDHRSHAPESITCAVLTISDTRTKETDSSGQIMRQHLNFRGHEIAAYVIVPDDVEAIRSKLDSWIADPSIKAILINGGTGISGRDVTYDAIVDRYEKHITGFGELFRMLSWSEIGAASMLSRASAGVANSTLIFNTPGSSNAVKLAMEKLIGPELGHMVYEISK